MHSYRVRRPRVGILVLATAVGASWALTMPSEGFETEPTATAIAGTSPDIVLAQATTKVTFSAEQADRGETRYGRECVDCHGDDLGGGLLGGPPLRGVAFLEKFGNGAPASGLFLFMSTAMPPDNPGRFTAAAYAEMMAFILEGNGFAEGAPLPSDPAALDTLIMEK
ncbi:MAG: c-type cytochrome [Bauldia sp.]|nr:c-type cytochrome [Bauldia sp.]